MIARKQQFARLQSDFYRDCYYKIMRGVFVCSVIILFLVIAIISHIVSPIQPYYYGTAISGQIIPMTPASQQSAGS